MDADVQNGESSRPLPVESESVSSSSKEEEGKLTLREAAEPNVPKSDCVIVDINKCNSEDEKICRICHLSADQNRPSESDLIELGCSCKEELGVVHPECAETWFKLKGNRCCEICGDSAKNIMGVGDNRFTEEWNERAGDSTSVIPSEIQGFWRGQPFFNFVMTCMVIAFMLPWFFHVNVF